MQVPQDIALPPVGRVDVGIGDSVDDEPHRIQLPCQGDFGRPAQLALRLRQLEGLYADKEVLQGFDVEFPVEREGKLAVLQGNPELFSSLYDKRYHQ